MTMAASEGLLVIARMQDGQVLKGTTHDFAPTKPTFHLAIRAEAGSRIVEISLSSLKAVFFVKSFEGDPRRLAKTDFDAAKGQGRRVVVTFTDGEAIAGFTVGYSQGKPGFFLIPADSNDNNARVFVVNAAVRSLKWLTGVASPPAGSTGS
jgi:hypothetical protein